MAEVSTKVKMSRRVRRSPTGDQCVSAGLVKSFLARLGCLSLLYFFLYLELDQKQKFLLSEGS